MKLIFYILIALAYFAFSPGRSSPLEPQWCHIGLVLAADMSNSVDKHEAYVQRYGYARAFADPEITDLIQAVGGIAVTYVEWSSWYNREQIFEWAVLRTRSDALAFSAALEERAESHVDFPGYKTHVGGALFFSVSLFDVFDDEATAPCRVERRVIDISGDGKDSIAEISPRSVVAARIHTLTKNVTINGLAIVGSSDTPNLTGYYEEHVVGGPGSFLISIAKHEEFPEAVRRKLILEIASIE